MMERSMANDLKFMGDSHHPGGQFRDVAIMGRVVLEGDVTCRGFACMGEARLLGGLQSGHTGIMGQTTVAGPLDAGDFKVLGQMNCDGPVRARMLNCMGQLRAGGQVDAGGIKLFGELRVQGDCNVDVFQSWGSFQVEGLLSVDKLQVKPHGLCRAREIGGAKIEVLRRWGRLGWLTGLLSAGGDRLEVETVEGDDIHLEYTQATVVRGARVRIGRGCRIGTVEYSGSYDCEADAQVGEARRV
jgi:cytoskeletal protein CcmA (bactofilin family)